MTQQYIYTDKVGAGPEHPDKQWGLYSTVLTPEKAKARYDLNAMHRAKWFGVVLGHGDDRPTAYLQVCPRANGVVLQKLNRSGSIEASYTWVAYYTPPNLQAYEGTEDRVFFTGVTQYRYPDGDQYYRQNQSTGHTTLTFREDGYAKEEKVTKHGFNVPSDVELSEYQNVDVSAHWFTIPDFGDWASFFHPETKVLLDGFNLFAGANPTEEKTKDQNLSQAIVEYLEKGKKPFPGSNEGAVEAFAKSINYDPIVLLDKVQAIVTECGSIKIDWSTHSLVEGGAKVRQIMSERHPELHEAAVDALSWMFTYMWR